MPTDIGSIQPHQGLPLSDRVIFSRIGASWMDTVKLTGTTRVALEYEASAFVQKAHVTATCTTRDRKSSGARLCTDTRRVSLCSSPIVTLSNPVRHSARVRAGIVP